MFLSHVDVDRHKPTQLNSLSPEHILTVIHADYQHSITMVSPVHRIQKAAVFTVQRLQNTWTLLYP